jgi:hypothetical protein
MIEHGANNSSLVAPRCYTFSSLLPRVVIYCTYSGYGLGTDVPCGEVSAEVGVGIGKH